MFINYRNNGKNKNRSNLNNLFKFLKGRYRTYLFYYNLFFTSFNNEKYFK